ncbi:MAG: nucleotidyltransferase family protein [Acidobacteria bacterium]|nr:nucleotidyltransferase family protein [Acidobacteriota bacterium]
MTRPLLVRVWREPALATQLGEPLWEQLVAEARRTQLLGRLAARLEDAGVLPHIPRGAQKALASERVLADHEARVIRWEATCLARVLADLSDDLILLKGAAYMAEALQVSRGRLSSDVDILVPRERLDAVEQALLAHGWAHVKLEPYDQLYYRQWTHELPPLQHTERETFVDVHHAILPITSRLQPDVARLRARARPAADGSQWKVLAPEHMVIHSAVHGFHDGELTSPLGDILDIHQLVAEFTARDAAFPSTLLEEGQRLGVQVPLGHALRAASRWLGALHPAFDPAPPSAQARLVDAAVDAMVVRSLSATGTIGTSAAGLGLYMRSHWLKMPPVLLARHLTVKLLSKRKVTGRPDLVGR